MRDVAYEATSLARRRLLHRRIAAALRLEPFGSGTDDRTRVALIAGHEREAGRPEEAALAFLEAAGLDEAVFANREAIDHLESAMALGHPDGAAIHTRIGELRSRLGEYPAAIASLETAAALAVPSELPMIEIALGRVHRRRGDLVAAASYLESVLSSADVTEPIRARALVDRSVVALQAGDLDTAGMASLEARELAGRLTDPHLAGVAERLGGLVAHSRGEVAAARGMLERSVELERRRSRPDGVDRSTHGTRPGAGRRRRRRRGRGHREQGDRGVQAHRRSTSRGRGREPPRRPVARGRSRPQIRWLT